jgi:hypothetical protein
MNNNLNMNNDSQQNQNNLSNTDIIKFKHNIKNWLDIDSKILELQSEIKQLRKAKKELEPTLTLFMIHNNITDINTDNGKLKCSEKITRSGLTSKHIRENLSKVLQNEQITEKAMEQILNNREIKKSYQIKKSKK